MQQRRRQQDTTLTRALHLLATGSVAGVLAAVAVFPVVGGVGLAARDATDAFDALPSDLNASAAAEKTVMLDATGAPIASFFAEYRESVRLDQVAPVMRKAIVAIEDSRFYSHGALDLRGALRALVTDTQAGTARQGGSSLTQQYVKNVLLDTAATPAQERAVTAQTLGRKVRELRYALAVEQHMSKDQILAGYLNIAYFGAGAYGVQAAAKRYFDIPAADLSLGQAALLAGVTNSPVAYDPTLHPAAARARRDTVLYRMAQLGVITRDEAEGAARRPIRLSQFHPRGGCEASRYPFFCEYVRYEMFDVLSGGRYWTMRPDQQARIQTQLQRGGYLIRTTLDPVAQRAAEQGLASRISPLGHVVGAQAMVEPGTGRIKAIAVSKPFGEGRHQTSIDLAADTRHGGGSGVSAGSTFKVFTLMAALDQGIAVNTRINSPQTISLTGFRPCRYTGTIDGHHYRNRLVGGGNWSPVSNAGDSEAGDFDLKQATWDSVNTYYAQLEQRVGVCAAVSMARAFGMVRADGEPLYPVPSQVLGTNEIDMVHLAAAYAGIAAHGRYCVPFAVTGVTDPAGAALRVPSAACHQAVKPSLADETTSILRGVLTNGTGKGVPSVGRPAAGKTGTCEAFSCAVFAGYTPNLAAAVAYWDPRGEYRYPVTGVFGATIPGPIWALSLRGALRNTPVVPFTDPVDHYGDARAEPLPDVTGQPLSAAEARLTAAGFTVQVSGKPVASTEPKGTVARTTPDAGTAAQGSPVVVFVSDGTGSPSPTATPPAASPTPSD